MKHIQVVNDVDYLLKRNDYSWSESAHMIYLEQPIRTGFSKAATGARQVIDWTIKALYFNVFL
jgi:carboxypeptidase C (cathepsin A)